MFISTNAKILHLFVKKQTTTKTSQQTRKGMKLPQPDKRYL